MSRRIYMVDASKDAPAVTRRQEWDDPELTFAEAREKAIRILRAKRDEINAEIRQLRAEREPARPPRNTSKVANAELVAARAWAWMRKHTTDGVVARMDSELLIYCASELEFEWRTDWNLTTTMRLVLAQAKAADEMHLVDTERGSWPWPGRPERAPASPLNEQQIIDFVAGTDTSREEA